MSGTISPHSKAAENLAGQNISTAASTSLAEVLSFLRRNNKRWKGPTWRKFSTTRLDEPRIRAFMAAFSSQIEALAAWAVLETIFNFLLRNLVFWENDPPGLGLPVPEWLAACRLDENDEDFFLDVLSHARDAGLLIFEKNETEIFISAPEIVDDADEYTKRLLRKIQGSSSSQKGKKPSRLDRLEEQVAKLTQTVAQLTKALQDRGPAASVAPAPAAPASSKEEEPSEEEKEEILSKFKKKFGLETDDWRKAVILLAFPPKTSPGPGYLTKMTDLSQTSLALARWRERRKKQLEPDRLQKLEEARVYAEMVRQGFNFSEVPAEIAGLVQKILERRGNGYAQRA